jgi:carbonic anhydrase/acetyltransferase-like protein (isoleucine patch superfamily)
MAVYTLGDLVPHIDPTAYVHPTAELIGDVVIPAHASVWPGAVLRADFNRIEVGEGAAVEDNVVVHPRGRGRPRSDATRSSGIWHISRASSSRTRS